MPDRVERIPVKNLRPHTEVTPPHDAVLDYPLERALEGNVPVYFAAIPLGLIRPFSDQYDPRQHKLWPQLFESVRVRWEKEQFQKMLVYPRKNVFIMSDDYITYYACVAGNPEAVPCWVLGAVHASRCSPSAGTMSTEGLREALLGPIDALTSDGRL
jgi:hypothetical protein